jgi:hypothetical protein
MRWYTLVAKVDTIPQGKKIVGSICIIIVVTRLDSVTIFILVVMIRQ